MSINKPIYICGVQRSGTTLLAQLLSKHGSVRILWETHCYPFFWRPFPGNRISIRAIEKLRETSYRRDPYLNEIASRLIAKGEDINGAYDLLRKILDEFRDIHGMPDRVGEKTPSHVFYVPDILKHDHDARIIVMIRDPRAVFLSEKTKYARLGKGSLSPVKIALRWKLTAGLAERYQKKYGKETILLAKYEKLILDPGEMLREVCGFLGLAFEERMLGADVVNSSFVPGKGDGFSEENIDRWRQLLAPEEVARLEDLLAKSMLKLDYPVLTSSGHGMSRFRANSITTLGFLMIGRLGRMFPSTFHFLIKDRRYRKLEQWTT